MPASSMTIGPPSVAAHMGETHSIAAATIHAAAAAAVNMAMPSPLGQAGQTPP